MSIKKLLTIISIIAIVLFILTIYQIDFIIGLITFTLLAITYYVLSNILRIEQRKNYIEDNLKIAGKSIVDTNKFIIIIIKNDHVIWANDLAYDEFPILLSDREITAIGLDQLDIDNSFKFKENVYEVSRNDGLYVIENVTKSTRIVNSLTENKTNIGYFQIDNYNYMRTNMNETYFLKFEKDFREDLLDYFRENNIYYMPVRQDRYQLILPTSVLKKLQNDKFKLLNEIMKQYQNEDTLVTYTMGIATNYENVRQIGSKSAEAFELAITRGGAQVVIFDNETTSYYGGSNAMIRGNTRMKSRVTVNTMFNLIKKREVVYLMTHKNPDSDAIASILLLNELIRSKNEDIEIRILIDEVIDTKLEKILIHEQIKYRHNYVVDQSKKNLLIILDTQSLDIISHLDVLEEIEDVVIFDHHQTPINYIKRTIFSWIEPNTTSTVEMICEMMIGSQVKLNNKDLANLAILGVLNDTNNLKYRVDQNTLEILGYLVSSGGNIEAAQKLDYIDFEDFKIKQSALSNVILFNGFAFVEITKVLDDVLLSIICNEMLEINKVRAAIIVAPLDKYKQEIKKMFKIKIRSNNEINSKILIEEFGGGGHARQGAGVLNKTDKEAFINKLYNYQEKE